MKKSIYVIAILLLVITSVETSAQPQQRRGGSISGHVIDGALNTSVEYANIVLYNKQDSVQVTGTITDPDGNFNLPGIRRGSYFISIRFVGYRTQVINDIEIRRGKANIDLGDIPLKQSAIQLESVELLAEQAPVEYRIDKKVINVSGQHTAASGTAAEVLENVPSVTVDIEGNVSLRGSANFTVLIDGKPTVLEPNDALQQIPASTIENIELITNPSAKHDPDGTSGIINILLKKGQLQGHNGVVNMNAGLEDKHGGDFLLQFRRKKINTHIGANYNKRFNPGTAYRENRTLSQGTTSLVFSNGDYRRGRTSYGLRAGIEFDVSSRDNLSLGLRYGDRAMEWGSELDYDAWTEPSNEAHLLYLSLNDRKISGKFYSVNMDYQHRFAGKGHKISGQVNYSHRATGEKAIDELLDTEQIITSGRQTTEQGPSDRTRLKIDYTLPLQKKNKIEAGYQSRLNNWKDVNALSDFDPVQNSYISNPLFSHNTDYRRNIHSLYALYAGEIGPFGYQGGIRGEYTDRRVELIDARQPDTIQPFVIDRWDYFPTVHASYKFTDGRQIMASYARRIERSRGWYLEPFETWTDAYNVRTGNPALKPEYIDSYELGTQAYFGSTLISTEGYYRVTHNQVERVRSVYSPDVTLHTIENVGTDYSLGIEFMTNIDLLKRWNINAMGNFYNYKIEGQLYGTDFSRSSFNWNMRFNNSISLGKSTKLQANAIYNSASVSSQGSRDGFYLVNLAVKQDLLGKNLSMTFQINDILGTAKHHYVSEGPNFFSLSHFTRESPVVMLNLRYNINNYKAERRRENGHGREDSEEDGAF